MKKQTWKLVLSVAAGMAIVGVGATAQNLRVVGKTESGDGLFWGNVGVGITPAAKLHVSGNVLQENGNTLQAKNTSGTAENWMWPRWVDNVMYTNYGANGWNIRTNAGTPVMMMDSVGKVGVGTTAPQATLQVNGSVRVGASNNNFNAQGGNDSLNLRTADTDYAYIKGEGIGTSDAGGLSVHLGDDDASLFKIVLDDDVHAVHPDLLRVSATETYAKGSLYAGNSDLYFTNPGHAYTGIGNTAGYAAIENASNYGSLMILGRAGTSVGRRVDVWDYLQVNGSTNTIGNSNVNGSITTAGNVTANGAINAGGAIKFAPSTTWQSPLYGFPWDYPVDNIEQYYGLGAHSFCALNRVQHDGGQWGECYVYFTGSSWNLYVHKWGNNQIYCSAVCI